MKHTPGKWHVDGPERIWVCNSSGQLICKINETRGIPSAQANARLISAAPELLEACKHAFSFFNKRGEGPLLTSTEMYLELRDAIAQAEGNAS